MRHVGYESTMRMARAIDVEGAAAEVDPAVSPPGAAVYARFHID